MNAFDTIAWILTGVVCSLLVMGAAIAIGNVLDAQNDRQNALDRRMDQLELAVVVGMPDALKHMEGLSDTADRAFTILRGYIVYGAPGLETDDLEPLPANSSGSGSGS